MDNILNDKILGCLVGGAVGDALGYPVEFMTYRQILDEFGPKGITRYLLDDDGIAQISDDTQMTLFTANGLVNYLNGQRNDGAQLTPTECIKQAYLEWYNTQTNYPSEDANCLCWLSQIPEMYSRRAPGNTCMSALSMLLRNRPVSNNSKGCGGIMRVAPVALFAAANQNGLGWATKIACEAALLTHQHPQGYLPAGLMAYVILDVIQRSVAINGNVDKDYVKGSINKGFDELRRLIDEKTFEGATLSHLQELRHYTDQAIELAESQSTDVEAFAILGEGWTGDTAWYVSIYCVLRHFDSFEDAVVAAVNHSGDSDSTGAITGNIIGAILGYDAIPDYYKQNLELLDVIQKAASEIINS